MKKISAKIPLWIALACCIVSAIPRNQHTLFSGVNNMYCTTAYDVFLQQNLFAM